MDGGGHLFDMKNRGVIKFIAVRWGHKFIVNDHGEYAMFDQFSLIVCSRHQIPTKFSSVWHFLILLYPVGRVIKFDRSTEVMKFLSFIQGNINLNFYLQNRGSQFFGF